MSEAASALKKTPLNEVHRASGAKMVDFGGLDMPVQYSGCPDAKGIRRIQPPDQSPHGGRPLGATARTVAQETP
jgi:glycine cleavage system aminomethyltransferase T